MNKRKSKGKSITTVVQPVIPKKDPRGNVSHINIIHEERKQGVQHISFSGPLPPPEALSQYESISNGLAERIVQMAEREQAHRHEQEKQALTEDEENNKRGHERLTKNQEVNRDYGKRGQICAIIVAFGYFIMLGVLGFFRMETAVGIGLGTAVVIGLPQIISLLVTSRKTQTASGDTNEIIPADKTNVPY
jgi:uncharacterized membrane protein